MTIRFAVTAAICVGAVLCGATACSSDSGGGSRATLATSSSSPYSLKLYVRGSSQQTLYKFGPIETSPATMADASVVAPANGSGTGIHIADITPTPGETQIGSLPPVLLPQDAQTVVVAAAAQCGMVGNSKTTNVEQAVDADPATYSDLYQQFQNKQTILSEVALNPAWDPSVPAAWYIFPSAPKSCDQVLEYEEALLCVADKLSELADAISPVVWPNAQFVTENAAGVLSWVIPPQAEQDKFVARDTAIEVLSHIAWLDSYPFTAPAGVTGWPGNTCSALYAGYDTATSAAPLQAALAEKLFSSTGPVYPPYTSGPLGASRLAFETTTLRTAGQLLHDLVRESVYSDLSGAAQQAANAADPKGGQSLAWGLNSPPTPYNSIGHAVRVLTGRWEMGDGEPDPACQGTSELNLINLADPGTQARANSTPPMTHSQVVAASLFESSGVVLTDAALTTADIRGTLTTQLIANAAQSQQVTPAVYAASPAGVALSSVLGTLADADIANAAQRTRTSFALSTATSTSNANSMLLAASRSGGTATALSSGAGVVVSGGVPSGQTAADPTARAGAMMAASQCFEEHGTAELTFDESAIAAVTQPVAATAERWMRQDVFAIAQSLRSRLVKMREVEDQSQPVGPGTPPDAASRGAAVAELGAWAGSARAVLTIGTADKNDAVFLDLEGIDLSTFGATAATDLLNIIELVADDAPSATDSPVLAECAAGLPGSSCSASALAAATWKPVSVQVLDSGTSLQRQKFGTTGLDLRLTFLTNAGAPVGLQNVNPSAILNTDPLYIVATSYTGKPAGVGDVMGAVRLPAPLPGEPAATGFAPYIAAVTLSPMRDELLYDVLGVGQWVGTN